MRFIIHAFLITVIGSLIAEKTFSADDLKIERLRCEYLENPLGIDDPNPRLSWILTSDIRGQKQTAYQILVASRKELLEQNQGDLWDSGKIESNRSIHVAYAGKPLESQTFCFWKVRVWDKDGRETPWSEPAFWSMGLLKPTDWKAQWIGLEKTESAEKIDSLRDIHQASWIWTLENAAASAPAGKVYFRRVVEISGDKKIAKMTALFSADNSHVLWVNGEKLGQGGNYNQLNEYDITDTVKPGKNVVAIMAENVGPAANPAGLIGCIRIEYEGESLEVIPTNESWKASSSEAADWLSKSFDDSQWIAAKVVGKFGSDPWGEISASDSESEARRLPARYLRREFGVDKPVKQAIVYVCGLGLYELYLNGGKIGDRVLQLGLTEYEKRVFYETFDVTNKLTAGSNVAGVILGNGRFYAPRLKVPIFTKNYGCPQLLFQLVIDYADGTRDVIISDKNWKVTDNGPIRANNEYDGEEYDARMELTGWRFPGYNDSSWKAVDVVAAPTGVLRAQMIQPIRVVETIKPIAVANPKPGMYVFDMGQNMVGWCRLTVSGPKGTEVKLRHAEVLNPDGTLYLANIRSAQVTDIYTFKGEGVEVYEPRFTYHGFRYVEMTGFPGKPDLSALEGRVVHDDVEQVGEFVSSNPLLNQIRKNIFWGVRGNYRSFPTDCPQRDERQAWLGDRAAESKGETFLFDIAALYAKWMADIDDAQRDDGSVPSVAPTYWPIFPDDVTWPSAFTITPSSLYDQYGDVRVLQKRYSGMKKWIEYMSRFLENGIMPRDTYGDWCVPPESPELIHSKDPSRQTAKPVLGTTYFYKNLMLMARYASILGREDDAAQFKAKAEEINKAFNEKFFDKEKCQYDNGSQTSFVLPLAFGMVPEEYKQKVFENLVNKILTETKGHIGTGLIGGQWLMRVLSDNGRPDVAYTIATQKDYPSWGYMIAKGATTIWELWNGDTADPAMNSGNHVMLVGDLNIWFHEYLAGIQSDPNNPAFKHIVMRPVPVGDLTACKAVYRSIHGRIVSDWKIEDGKFMWNVEVPANTTATIYIPANDATSVLESGKAASEAEGVKFERMESGRAVFTVLSGKYQFMSNMM